jgi:hypothetical protein
MDANPAFLQYILTIPRRNVAVVEVSGQSGSKAIDKPIRRGPVFLLIADHESAETIFLYVAGYRHGNAGKLRLIRSWLRYHENQADDSILAASSKIGSAAPALPRSCARPFAGHCRSQIVSHPQASHFHGSPTRPHGLADFCHASGRSV